MVNEPKWDIGTYAITHAQLRRHIDYINSVYHPSAQLENGHATDRTMHANPATEINK